MNSELKTSRIRRNLYLRWYHMIERCYDVTHPRYKDYGGRGVYVSVAWRDKEIFFKDAVNLPGYDETKLLSGLLHLDKDSRFFGNSVYSKDTCAFVSIEENNKYVPSRMPLFIGISPNGVSYESFNQSEFARLNNLRQSKIADCLNNRAGTHRGWIFKYKE